MVRKLTLISGLGRTRPDIDENTFGCEPLGISTNVITSVVSYVSQELVVDDLICVSNHTTNKYDSTHTGVPPNMRVLAGTRSFTPL